MNAAALAILARERRPVRAADIADVMRENNGGGPSAISISRLLSTFASEGLVTRKPAGQGEKTFLYQITDKGRSKLTAWGADRNAQLPEERIKDYNEALHQIGLRGSHEIRGIDGTNMKWVMMPIGTADQLMRLAIKGSVR
jgi:DNA-binding PadR family transcriptional regulator